MRSMSGFSENYDRTWLQERVRQKAAEAEVIERRLQELTAMQAQLNVSDEDRDKSSDALRHEVWS